jgi:Na+-driven multidrug efflux pump
VVVLSQWGLFLPLAYIAGPVLGLGLAVIWSMQVGYRAVMAVVFTRLWVRGDWSRIHV